ncbi:MAG: hypothetical protein H7X71_00905 [Chitinophagales bacterium]|nr:hypothetical protein [Chitinophagales bacterium]
MKKIFFLLVSICCMQLMHAQTSAIGLRLSGGSLLGAEASYQQWMGNNNRIEADLGFNSRNWTSVLQFTVLYQWVFELEAPFNWYCGVGGSTGFWDFNDEILGNSDGGFFINADFDIGIEYTFEIPLQVSLDLRPQIGLLNSYDSFDGTLGLGVRYTF